MEYKQIPILRNGTIWKRSCVNDILARYGVKLAPYIKDDLVRLLPASFNLMLCPTTHTGYLSFNCCIPAIHHIKYDVLEVDFNINQNYVYDDIYKDENYEIFIVFNTAEARTVIKNATIKEPTLLLRKNDKWSLGPEVEMSSLQLNRLKVCGVTSILERLITSNMLIRDMCFNRVGYLDLLKRSFIREKEYVIYRNRTFNTFDRLVICLPNSFKDKSYKLEHFYYPDHVKIMYGTYSTKFYNRFKEGSICQHKEQLC